MYDEMRWLLEEYEKGENILRRPQINWIKDRKKKKKSRDDKTLIDIGHVKQ